tara:strand:+ start:164 stop:904 length:741 start_codon:yes stop_codon:yes gene_type:complete
VYFFFNEVIKIRISNLLIVLILVILQPAFSFAGEKEEAMGMQIYLRYCAQCHGEKGMGDGPNVKAADMDPVPRDLCDIEKPYMKNKDNNYLIKAIAFGGLGIDKSQFMPRFSDTLSEYELFTLVAFLRTLHKHNALPLDFSTVKNEKRKVVVGKINVKPGKVSRREAMIGRKIYGKYGCLGCHSIDNRGGISGGSLTAVGKKLDAQTIWQIIKAPSSVNSKSRMPAFDINEEAGELLVKYLMSLKG